MKNNLKQYRIVAVPLLGIVIELSLFDRINELSALSIFLIILGLHWLIYWVTYSFEYSKSRILFGLGGMCYVLVGMFKLWVF